MPVPASEGPSAFVPADFEPPGSWSVRGPAMGGLPDGDGAEHLVRFRLEPLGPEHNERDYRAWTSSIAHIRASPGFAERRWPHDMTLEENADDLREHAADFAARRGFTYTVLDPGGDVVGCVYIYPDDGGPDNDGPHDAQVRSWVRADHAEVDPVLRAAVAAWLRRDWPFRSVAYAGTPSTA